MASRIVSRRYGIWSEMVRNWASFSAEWVTFSEKTSVSPSNRPTFVEVEPGLIARTR